ncbi:PQQ-dependent sugar dehydrogenase [Rhodoligotrophos ferricapiens]|uniref:PQQ-dependent sugar dehydrogenase n=1 Tax=Rhodoligotrophos ferricapiens TaxID=3069264 RepID=UPI003D81550E
MRDAMHWFKSAAAAIAISAVFAGVMLCEAKAEPGEVVARLDGAEVTVFAEGLEHPWGMVFLDDGRALVTERPGRLRIVSRDGRLSRPLSGVPKVDARDQGGLLDVALDPTFAENRLVYLSYAERGEGGNGTAVARGRLDGDGLVDTTVIFRQLPKKNSTKHFGSRLAFAPDGTLFITLGERFSFMKEAQDLSSHLGKVVRINPDGSVPRDNPFVGRERARPEIWSYGHRNTQSAQIRPDDGTLWIIEHGARGGDEINKPEAGKNYGWPVISYGRHYDGSKIGEGTSKRGMEQPLHYWDPSIAPSGMLFYTGDAFPNWKGSLFVGALKSRELVRLTLQGETVTGQDDLLEDLGRRIRDVRQGPDGHIYLLTDEDEGLILRISPKG